jgi:isopentenyl-diphosphate delta-isomerase type 1
MPDELLDAVNENDEVTGQAMRSAVHRQGLWHRGAHVFLFNENNEMLIQRRSADRSNSPSLLDCSVSEHVQAGEGYLEAALRGLIEELGLKSIELKLVGKIQMEYGPNDNEISVIYEGKVDPDKVQFDREEISEVGYMSLDEIKEGIMREKEIFCGWFVELMNWYFGQPARLKEM